MTQATHKEIRKRQKAKFLEEFAKLGIVGPCAKAIGVTHTTILNWRKKDEQFAADYEDAYQLAVDEAEAELRKRGVDGVEEVVLYKGEPVWKRCPSTGQLLLDDDFNPVPFTIPKRSDRLLEVYVRSHRPIYKEKSEVALTDPAGNALDTTVTVNFVLPEGKTAEDYEDYKPEDQ